MLIWKWPYISISFGKEIDKNRLEMALLDESARGRLLGIKEEIFSILSIIKILTA
jgi:hypothetical protein